MAVRKKPKRAVKKVASKETASVNIKAHWKAFEELQNQVDKAWLKLQHDVNKKAPSRVLVQDKNQLLLLLGECNYMARECMRCCFKPKR